MKKFISTFLLFHFVLTPSLVTASHKALRDEVSIPVGSLSQDPVAKSLRVTLNRYADGDQTSEALDAFGIRPYLPLFREKFVVLEIRDGDFGGYWINIFISEKQMVPLLIWIYDIGENEYEIRSIEKKNLSKKDRKNWEPLRAKKYIQYWL